MASTAERIRQLVSENIEVDGKALEVPEDLNLSLSDAGVPSTDMVALAKLIAQDFNVTFTPDDCAALTDLSKVVAFLDSKSA